MKVVLSVAVLILLILLITPGAAAPGTTTVVAVQGAMTVNTVGVVPGGSVLVPRMAGPRSPYVPPSWTHYSGPTTRGPRSR